MTAIERYYRKVSPDIVSIIRKSYIDDKLTPVEIGKIIGLCEATVRYNLKINNIPMRTRSEAMEIRHSKNNKYPFGYITTNKNGYAEIKIASGIWKYYHVFIWEQEHDMPLPDGWVVHHLNGVKDDDRPENLVGMPRDGHSPILFTKLLQSKIRELEDKLSKMPSTF
jgi:hypothetical protein